MTSDRRNDMGNKILISTVALLVTTIMGFSITTAQRASAEARANAIDISSLKADQVNLKEIMCEVREDIKKLLGRDYYPRGQNEMSRM